MVSYNEPNDLPNSLRQGMSANFIHACSAIITIDAIAGATTLCSVTSNLSSIPNEDLDLKVKRGCCSLSYRYCYICNFDIRVIVAPADLRFELWFKGVKYSGNHEPVSINWDPAELQQ